MSCSGEGAEWTYLCSGNRMQLRMAAESLGATIVDDDALSLDDIFVTRVSG